MGNNISITQTISWTQLGNKLVFRTENQIYFKFSVMANIDVISDI